MKSWKEDIGLKIFFFINGVIVIASGVVGGILTYGDKCDLAFSIVLGFCYSMGVILFLIPFWFCLAAVVTDCMQTMKEIKEME